MSSRKCKSCKCSCLLFSIGCIKGLLNPFISTTPEDRIRAAVDEATIRYIIPVIGSPCFEAICSALDASELPNTDPDYVALPEHYETFLEVYAKTILSEAATALYIDFYGYDRLSIDYTEKEQLHSDYRKARYAGAAVQKNALKTWLESGTDGNNVSISSLFTCLPTVEEDDCYYDTGVGMETEFGDFAASTRHPAKLRPDPTANDIRRLENP